jgi:hypothetical protein
LILRPPRFNLRRKTTDAEKITPKGAKYSVFTALDPFYYWKKSTLTENTRELFHLPVKVIKISNSHSGVVIARHDDPKPKRDE